MGRSDGWANTTTYPERSGAIVIATGSFMAFEKEIKSLLSLGTRRDSAMQAVKHCRTIHEYLIGA